MPSALPQQKWTIEGNQDKAVRDLEIDPALFTPKNQLREWVRKWPEDMGLVDLLGGSMPNK